VYDRQLALIPQWLEGRQGRVQSEKSIEINDRIARNIDGWPHRIICLLGVRDHDVQSVSSAALEDHDQPLVLDAEGLGSIGGTSKKSGNSRCADYRDSTIAKKYATSDWHKNSS
jgi:hypothetical protein